MEWKYTYDCIDKNECSKRRCALYHVPQVWGSQCEFSAKQYFIMAYHWHLFTVNKILHIEVYSYLGNHLGENQSHRRLKLPMVVKQSFSVSPFWFSLEGKALSSIIFLAHSNSRSSAWCGHTVIPHSEHSVWWQSSSSIVLISSGLLPKLSKCWQISSFRIFA